ncbi:asparaginyl-tRNA synthetase [Kickxella alabastrina]|uniref:asparaginyl-tRNA synthetase n=1 Tax=Kickxella alabastrina TaxID=61397 RepID=UPI00221F74FC|nr:asparaginyl-tRNA synthetase [Kickxella alabastrina]KAI7826381.1 asparaginyl-tRNA synthetase [Kickxella alabastrina]
MAAAAYHVLTVQRKFSSKRPGLGLSETLKSVINTGTPGDNVKVTGWVRSVRMQKRIAFAEVTDGSTLHHHGRSQMATDLSTGCSVEITGKLATSPGREQSKEIQATHVSVIGKSDPESYPLQKKRHTLEFLREIGYLRPRSQTIGAVTRLRDQAEIGLHKFFHDHDFMRIHTPALTTNDCEGGGETFNVVNLTVSGQLHLEVFAGAFKRVYNFNQSFRAEPSQTGRHLSEFWMLEAECAFMNDLPTLVNIEEEMIRSTTQHIADTAGTDLDFFLHKNEDWASFYTEAIDILQRADAKAKFSFKPQWGQGLQSEHERYLATTHFAGPVFVTDYPADIKSFYMLPNPDGRTVACMDLLVPGPCELLGGSLRDHDYQRLKSKVESLGFEEGSLDWYLDLRKYGSTPHGGFGMGFERYIQMITGLESVRDIIPFPRHAGRCQY